MDKDNYYHTNDTRDKIYAKRLLKLQTTRWKELLDVQAPYRWNLQRLNMGLTFEIGCGIGRNLINLNRRGVGIDHNLEAIDICRSRGLTAFVPDDFRASVFDVPESFDSILLSHVAEHMTYEENITLIEKYLYLLRLGGKLVVITPQEVGYRSDKTHVEFMNFSKLRNINESLNIQTVKQYSFPFPRLFGYLFIYNEFISVGRK